MTFAASITRQALNLINAYGVPLSYNAVSVTDTATNAATDGGATTTLKALVEDVKGLFTAGNLIAAADKRLTFSAGSFKTGPALKDEVTILGDGFVVVDVATYYLGKDPIMYVVHVKRA